MTMIYMIKLQNSLKQHNPILITHCTRKMDAVSYMSSVLGSMYRKHGYTTRRYNTAGLLECDKGADLKQFVLSYADIQHPNLPCMLNSLKHCNDPNNRGELEDHTKLLETLSNLITEKVTTLPAFLDTLFMEEQLESDFLNVPKSLNKRILI